ncbi:MAG: hypothetical protein ACJA06_001081 [Halocynthiibacter sp.]
MAAPLPSLTPDCARCAALCCLALAFDKGPRFAFDKPAGLPCPKLDHHRCSIHDGLDDAGFSGCIAYGCSGAGQRVFQQLYQGISWQDAPETTPQMIESFAHMRAIHDALELLQTAAKLPLSAPEQETLNAFQSQLNAPLTPHSTQDLATGPTLPAIRAFLKSLAHHLNA